MCWWVPCQKNNFFNNCSTPIQVKNSARTTMFPLDQACYLLSGKVLDAPSNLPEKSALQLNVSFFCDCGDPILFPLSIYWSKSCISTELNVILGSFSPQILTLKLLPAAMLVYTNRRKFGSKSEIRNLRFILHTINEDDLILLIVVNPVNYLMRKWTEIISVKKGFSKLVRCVYFLWHVWNQIFFWPVILSLESEI